MGTYALRQKLVDIALRDDGALETSRNRGPAIRKFWQATSLPEGYNERYPYCAAAVCYWVREWLKLPDVLKVMEMSAAKAEQWRCKSAGAFAWLDWANKKGVHVLSDSPLNTLHTGDLMVFDMSHIGIVIDDHGNNVFTIEANTGATGGRDGDGIFRKTRHRSLARGFIRLMP